MLGRRHANLCTNHHAPIQTSCSEHKAKFPILFCSSIIGATGQFQSSSGIQPTFHFLEQLGMGRRMEETLRKDPWHCSCDLLLRRGLQHVSEQEQRCRPSVISITKRLCACGACRRGSTPPGCRITWGAMTAGVTEKQHHSPRIGMALTHHPDQGKDALGKSLCVGLRDSTRPLLYGLIKHQQHPDMLIQSLLGLTPISD